MTSYELTSATGATKMLLLDNAAVLIAACMQVPKRSISIGLAAVAVVVVLGCGVAARCGAGGLW